MLFPNIPVESHIHALHSCISPLKNPIISLDLWCSEIIYEQKKRRFAPHYFRHIVVCAQV